LETADGVPRIEGIANWTTGRFCILAERIGPRPSTSTQNEARYFSKLLDDSFPRFIVKDSFSVSKDSQNVNSSQNANRDEVLKRMLKMKPQPHKSKKFERSQRQIFTEAKIQRRIFPTEMFPVNLPFATTISLLPPQKLAGHLFN
jgi:hypothetical protein